jgi:diacylglycerol kinase
MKLRGKYKKGKRTFADSVKNCLDGINYVLANEKNFVREIILGICAILMSYFLGITRIEWIIVLLLINFVLIMELLNTALEKVVDLYTTKYNEIAKVVKDVASASVFLMSLFSAVIGFLIFMPYIIEIMEMYL